MLYYTTIHTIVCMVLCLANTFVQYCIYIAIILVVVDISLEDLNLKMEKFKWNDSWITYSDFFIKIKIFVFHPFLFEIIWHSNYCVHVDHLCTIYIIYLYHFNNTWQQYYKKNIWLIINNKMFSIIIKSKTLK